MRFICIALMVIAASCQGTPRPDSAAVRAKISETNQLLERLYAQGKIDSAAAFFASDVWQMPPNAPPLVGRDAFREFWSQAVEWGTWRFDLQLQDVIVADSIAVERGSYTLSFEAGPQAPMPSSDDRGNYVVLWRLEADGAWRIVWDAPVSEVPVGGVAP